MVCYEFDVNMSYHNMYTCYRCHLTFYEYSSCSSGISKLLCVEMSKRKVIITKKPLEAKYFYWNIKLVYNEGTESIHRTCSQHSPMIFLYIFWLAYICQMQHKHPKSKPFISSTSITENPTINQKIVLLALNWI